VFTIARMFNKGVGDSQTSDSLVRADLKDIEKPNEIYNLVPRCPSQDPIDKAVLSVYMVYKSIHAHSTPGGD
jgi:hypothetical protein